MNYQWDFQTLLENADVLAIGAIGTIKIFLVTLVLGLGLGLVVGIGRSSKSRLINFPATVFVEVFRNTPVLVQIIWFYYALPIISPIEISPFMAAVLGITLNTAAFSAEIFRGGIQSIDPAQWEGAKSIGMTYSMTMRRVILPQAVRRMLPPLTNRGIEVFKMSTLASVVGYIDLLNQAKLISSINYNPIESYTMVAIIFFVFLYPLVQATYLLERIYRKSDD